MSLKHQQDLLARLYTDPAFRSAFFADPPAAAARLGIDPAEADAIAAVSREELDYFSETLFRKRLSEVGNLLPLTKAELGDRFAERFRTFARHFVPGSVKKHVEDAVRFCDFLRREKLSGRVAGYESALLRFHQLGQRAVFGVIDFDPRTGLKRRVPRPFAWLRIGSRRIVI